MLGIVRRISFRQCDPYLLKLRDVTDSRGSVCDDRIDIARLGVPITLSSAVSKFGASARAKLTNVAATGEPEDQLRGPLENLLGDLAELCRFSRNSVVAVGESSLGDLKTRPDYAISVQNALAGFIEVKAPGKGADPRRFRDTHDREQWAKLQSLPNLIYTDGNEFSLWRSGELSGELVRLTGDIETSGAQLSASPLLQLLFEDFFRWQPTPPRTAKQLAEMTARLCRLLRDEVEEQLERENVALTHLATDWRRLLFPEATDEQFADGYAQSVTFGLLMARARGIELGLGLDQVARQLTLTNSLIGSALRLVTDEAENQATLKTSLGTLTRVLDEVHWQHISRGDPDAWLYFYEDFLDIYDRKLRKLTGSYYTPPEVVSAMVRLVDDVLRSDRFALPAGLASPTVTIADPAVGTGTFLLGAFRRIADTVGADEGEGAVPAAIESAMRRMIAFELQLGPFAVAQLRVLAELTELTGHVPVAPLRMYVADTLSNPYEEEEWMPAILGPIAESRRHANEVKRDEAITVVIGNPPYKEKAKGRGGWVESGSANSPEIAPLSDWMPPREWGVGAHSKHLRNLYVYFWRWATWKVFDRHPTDVGVVCFITVAGFLNGPGFQKMRDYLRRKADDIWVVDCSPEGHQPEVNTRIFQGVQQPICIVLASRSSRVDESIPANVRFRSLPPGLRREKFEALAVLALDTNGWTECSSDWRAPFLPRATGAWSTYPALDDLFLDNGSGVMPGRTWVIAPDADSLLRRWHTLTHAPADEKEALFHPHLTNGQPGDRHTRRVVTHLPGHESRTIAVADDRDASIPPVRYAFRSFDRQWIIPDNRLLNRPNPGLWRAHSGRQVYLTALSRTAPSSGPAATFAAHIPDLDHFKGSFGGRVFSLWRDQAATIPNFPLGLLSHLTEKYGSSVSGADLMAYIAAIITHPSFTSRFRTDLVQPGLHIPLTGDAQLFVRAVEVGHEIIWLHTYGERFTDPANGLPAQPPRMPVGQAPTIPANGAISQHPDDFPDIIEYDAPNRRLLVGTGFIDNVSPAVWKYEVSGKQVIHQWFSYRKKARERPIIGDRRQPSRLGEIQPDRWPAEYTSELLNLLNVLARLIELEPAQAALLERVCTGDTITTDQLRAAGALRVIPAAPTRRRTTDPIDQHRLLD